MTDQSSTLTRRIPTDFKEKRHASHWAPLEVISEHFKPKTVLEFGSGLYSTGLFLEMPSVEKLHTVEVDGDWYAKVHARYGGDQKLVFRLSPGKAPQAAELAMYRVAECDLVFIDDGLSVGERVHTIELVRQQDKQPHVIVVHDTNEFPYLEALVKGAGAGWNAYNFDRVEPWTTVLWHEDTGVQEDDLHTAYMALDVPEPTQE